MTCRNNHHDNERGIPLTELPQTFQDAVTTARRLKLRYLWIDSLCIIQDDSDDWSLHVAAMADIYRNAYITLAAGASCDDDGGLFGFSDTKFTDARQVLNTDDAMHLVELQLRLRLRHPQSAIFFDIFDITTGTTRLDLPGAITVATLPLFRGEQDSMGVRRRLSVHLH